jgi:hypothetical protein
MLLLARLYICPFCTPKLPPSKLNKTRLKTRQQHFAKLPWPRPGPTPGDFAQTLSISARICELGVYPTPAVTPAVVLQLSCDTDLAPLGAADS